MQEKKKNEKPEWVRIVESLIPASRQSVGSMCASTIQSLGTIFEISELLFDAVVDAVKSEITIVHNTD